MVVKMSSPGRSFGGVADYCLHDPRMPGEAHHPESAERVEWTETRNLATSEGERAGRIMAATAEASPELKRLAGVAATGRKLEKPVCHYSLNWAKDEKPDRQEMSRAAEGSLKALGMERRQALIVSHRDGQPHVHVIANRVEPESGKAAGLSRSKLRLSKWAERYEREQGKIRCPARERNNARRGQGKRVQDRVSRPTGRHRREEMSPQREPREAIPAGPERERAAWQRAEERAHWEQLQRRRGKALGELEKRSKREWSALYGRHQRQREQLSKDCRGVLGRFRAWRELGGGVREIGGAIRGRQGSAGTLPGGVGEPATLGAGFVGEKRIPKRREGSRARRENSTAVDLEGSEKRAREAARSDGLLLRLWYRRPVELVQARRAQALGVGGAVGAGAGDRRRAGLREDEAGSGEGRAKRRLAKRRQGKRRGLGKWRGLGWSGIGKRRQGKAGSAVGRSGTLAPAASSL